MPKKESIKICRKQEKLINIKHNEEECRIESIEKKENKENKNKNLIKGDTEEIVFIVFFYQK